MWLWRAVDDDGTVLNMLVQKRRNAISAIRLLRKLLKHQGAPPATITGFVVRAGGTAPYWRWSGFGGRVGAAGLRRRGSLVIVDAQKQRIGVGKLPTRRLAWTSRLRS